MDKVLNLQKFLVKMFLLLVLFFIAFYYYYLTKRTFYLSLNKIPTYPNIMPLIFQFIFSFNITGLFEHMKKLTKFSNESNGVSKFWLGPFPVIVISNPEDADTVLNTCLNKGFVYKFSKPWVGDGLITSKASIWKHHIKKLSPAFNQKVIDGFIDIFNEQSELLVEKLMTQIDKAAFDIYPFIGAANLATICETAMGTKMDFQSTPNHPYLNSIKTMLKIITKRSSSLWLHLNCIFNLTKLKHAHDNAIEVLHKVSNDIIQFKKNEFDQIKDDTSETNTFRPFLDLILGINRKENIFTQRQIREQVDTMIAAGHETSSHAILFTLLCLAKHQEVQDKVYEELKEVFDCKECYVEKADLSKLIYLEAVMKESMRLYPVVPMVFRYVDKDIKLRNHIIPKGCNSAISIWGMNRDVTWGRDCNNFRPERWLNPNEIPAHPASFASFSYGKRVCIGRKYAMTSMKIMLSYLLRRFRFKAENTNMKFDVHFVLKPVENHLLNISLR